MPPFAPPPTPAPTVRPPPIIGLPSELKPVNSSTVPSIPAPALALPYWNGPPRSQIVCAVGDHCILAPAAALAPTPTPAPALPYNPMLPNPSTTTPYDPSILTTPHWTFIVTPKPAVHSPNGSVSFAGFWRAYVYLLIPPRNPRGSPTPNLRAVGLFECAK